MQAGYLGVDVGSVSTNIVLLDEQGRVVFSLYLRTQGQPIRTIKEGLCTLSREMPPGYEILGAGTTGSGRTLAGAIIGADTIKNEITAHALAACWEVPGVQTILEIGGQDSKIIILRGEVVTDFAMNTVCAAGTGSFLDQQAKFKGLSVSEQNYYTESFACRGCSNLCEIVNIKAGGELIARWGSRCGKWDTL